MTDQYWIPSIVNLLCSPHVSIEPMKEQSWIIEVEEKPSSSSTSVVWWHGYRETKEFLQNNQLRVTGQKSCSVWPAEALVKNWCYWNAADLLLLTCYLTIYR